VGGFSLAATKVWFHSLLRGTRYLIWSGAVAKKQGSDRLFQRLQRKLLVRGASGFIAYGSWARHYLVSLGADPSRVSIGINTVDCAFFQEKACSFRAAHSKLTGSRQILYVGNLESGKRIDNLFRAAKLLVNSGADFVIELVGSGSQEQKLKLLAVELGIQSHVRFNGFAQKEQVAEKLATAACFVFPSEYDVWGLVVIEAMAAGVPCLSSIHAGVTEDVIQDGKNGFALDFNDHKLVAERLRWILEHPVDASDMGRHAQQFIMEHVSLRASAAGFIEAIQRTTNPVGSPASVSRVTNLNAQGA